MRRRSRASSKLAKARSRRAKTLKVVRHSGSSASGPETEVARLTRELHEAQEQQAATAEVLKIISASPTALQPVLEVVARSAARFCEADDVTIFELDEQHLHTAAHWGAVPQEIGVRFPCVRGQVSGRAVLERRPVHVIDLQAEAEEFPEGSAFARRFGHRTIAAVPLLREGVAVGAIVLRRAEVNPFTDKQIALVQTFAAQGVIAIENTRLLNELRQSLDRQTATSEVLSVISSSPGELQPVFETMLQNAVRLCNANFGNIYRWDGDVLSLVATHNTPSALVEARRRSPYRVSSSKTPLGRVIAVKKTVHVVDAAVEEAYTERDPGIVVAVDLAGIRTFVAVPMLKEGQLIGILTVFRQEVCPFTDKQISLVENFAAQAVIAIENARLLNELRESLDQQTATSEVLRVISSSPGELKPVFNSMLENAIRLCESEAGNLYLYDGEVFHAAALHSASQAYTVVLGRRPRVGRVVQAGTPLGRRARISAVIDAADGRTAKGYIERDPRFSEFVDLSGARTHLAVPMLKENELIGAIDTYRLQMRPFTDKQIELLQNFAAQAIIAIENARLLSELRQSLEQQTATADVLKVISRSTF